MPTGLTPTLALVSLRPQCPADRLGSRLRKPGNKAMALSVLGSRLMVEAPRCISRRDGTVSSTGLRPTEPISFARRDSGDDVSENEFARAPSSESFVNALDELLRSIIAGK